MAGSSRSTRPSRRLLGYPAEAVIGHSFLEFAAPETRERVKRLHARVLECHSRRRPWPPTARTIPVEVVWRELPDADGSPVGVVSVHDLRERRRLEEEISQRSFYDPVTGLPEPGPVPRPLRPFADLGAPGRRRPGRGDPPRPGPLQGGQREPRPRGRRPAPGRGRPAPPRRRPAGRHGRPLRRRPVRGDARRDRLERRGRRARRPSSTPPCASRSTSTAGTSSSAPAWAS